MIKVLRIPFFILFLLFGAQFSSASTQDSVDTKVVDGKIFIVHEIEDGQTLYAISRQYGVLLDDILKANPELNANVIKSGQRLLIPTGKIAVVENPRVKTYLNEKEKRKGRKSGSSDKKPATFASTYTVQKGETLYAISKKFNTSAEVLMSLNEMEDPEIFPGQMLIVPDNKVGSDLIEKGEEPSNAGDGRITRAETQTKVSDKEDAKKAVMDMAKNPNTNANSNTNAEGYTIDVQNLADFGVEKITETGVAQVYADDADHAHRYLAYHHQAETGTILMVTNPANGKSVFAKVVGGCKKSGGQFIRINDHAAGNIGLEDGGSIEVSYAR